MGWLYFLRALLLLTAGVVGGLQAEEQPGKLISAWAKATPLPVPRYTHGGAVVGKFLYVLGGHSGARSVNDVYFAEFTAPGQLGPWQTTTALPPPAVSSPAVAVAGRRIYVIGGDPTVKEGVPVWYGDAASDGTIARWQEGPRVPAGAASGGCAVVCGNAVYYLGGWYNRQVHRAEIKANGDLDQWTPLNRLPGNLFGAGAGVAGNTVVLVAGSRTVTRAEENCYWATVADATKLKWRMTEPLPEANTSFATAQHQDRLFVAGGATLAVWATRILPNEGLAEWTPQAPLPHAASFLRLTAAVCHEGYVYAIGGLVNTKEGRLSGSNEVWVGAVKE